jgi:hypothetical protein
MGETAMISPAGTTGARLRAAAPVLAALVILAAALAGCGAGAGGLVDDAPPEVHPATGNDGATKVGQWAKAPDGLALSVTRLRRGTVPFGASGGRPGGPAAIVTLQIKNDSGQRFDLSLMRVVVRMGEQGSEAEEVFTGKYQGTPDSTLAPGKSSTITQMFAAAKASDLADIAVEITPGIEYDKVVFSGKA